jgi:AmmeMemoRadiSam system protein A
MGAYPYTLTEDEQRELLRIARASVKEFLYSGRLPPGAPHRITLTTPAGTFVTLHKGDELRGCIGTIHEDLPLYKSVQEMAVAASQRDPRFQAVSLEELTKLTFEVSVLGERRAIKDPEEIEIGVHGVCVTVGPRRGLLLPQVAKDHGWDAMTFLGKVCEKAELPVDGWRVKEAVVEVFSAQVFDEKKLPPLKSPFASK